MITHGLPGTYAKGCRCEECRVAATEYRRAYMHAHPEQQEKHRQRNRMRKVKPDTEGKQ